MDQFGVFKARIKYIRVAKGTEIHVDTRKITGIYRRTVKEAEPERGTCKHRVGYTTPGKSTPDKTYTGKVQADQRNGTQVQVDRVTAGTDAFKKGSEGLSQISGVVYTIFASRESGFRASLSGAGRCTVHVSQATASFGLEQAGLGTSRAWDKP